MEIKVLSEKGNTLKVLIKGINAAFANALRRQMMAGTQLLAVDDVTFYENSGEMHDEMLAHRLGMVPLRMDAKKYKEGDKVKLVLEKDGPCTVYSRDIKSTDPKIEPVDLDIPITKLADGQKLKLEMDAVVGTGKMHAKWQPGIISYQELPIISGAKDKSYKADVIEMLLDEKQRDIVLKDGQSIEYDPETFVFTIESSGNLSAQEILQSAAEGLKKKSEEFRKELKNLS